MIGSRRLRNRPCKPRIELLEDRCVPSTFQWNNFGGNAQHTGVSNVAAQPMDTILWKMSVDQQPWGAEHYGEPVFTANNTVIVPLKTGWTANYDVQGVNGANGTLMWSVATGYTQPPNYDWLPPFQSVYDPVNDRVYFAGNGGTIYYVSHPDNPGSSSPTPVQLAFYGISNYNSNPGAYNSSIYIDTPLTVDSSGNVFFGFTDTGTNPSGISQGGIARIGADGSGAYVLAGAAAGSGSNVNEAAIGSAPALSNDGTIVYAVLNSISNSYDGYLVGLNSTTLSSPATYSVKLVDPSSGNRAGAIVDSTASPMVAPDNTVFLGVFGNPYNGSRGFLLHFSENLGTKYTPGAFGWDDTPSIIPASMVPSYHGTSSFLILSKYNNYVAAEVGNPYGGNGVNQIAILDPYASQLDPNYDSNPNLQVMKQVMTLPSPTPDTQFTGSGYLDAVREWCTNGTAVDPATDSVFINNEDGYAYRWNLATNVLTQAVEITDGIGEPYTPTAIGPDGTVYALNGGTLFALGGYANYTETFSTSLHPSVVGQSITLTTTLRTTSGGPRPTGMVTYSYTEGANDPMNSTPVVLATVSLVNGVATYSTSSLGAGHYHIVAAYSGDSTYGAGSTTRVQVVLDTTSVVVTSSNQFAAAGTPVTLTATITPTTLDVVPLGTVTFKDGSTTLGTVNLNPQDGSNTSTTTTASFTTSSLPVGNDQITAVYNGDQNLAKTTSAVFTETINGTTTTLTSSSANPSVYGQAVTFTATVTPISTSGTPTGKVVFKSGTTVLKTVTLSGGTATFTTSTLAVGTDSITAYYGGDSNDASSVSNTLSQQVNQDGTTTTVKSSAKTAVYGQSVTLTARVTANTPGSGTPTGQVTFEDNGAPLAMVSLSKGVATYTTSSLPLGTNQIVVIYAGSTDYIQSTSATFSQTVNRDATSITLTSSANPSTVGQSVTFTAMVAAAPPGSGTPTGMVTFYDGTTKIGSASVDSSGTATFTTSALVQGSHNITARYGGDTDFKSVVSAVLMQTVDAPANPLLAAFFSSSRDKSALDWFFGGK
jgi:Bacterial Ig-like domain (group 3)